ncbi:MAG: chorismate synthase, partial [Ignavibacteria bacterium]|nr:chorismate synthase [Ignavibacteria bacterium]
GLRMKIENDKVEILSGIRYGKTLGSPISMLIWNNDWKNWTDLMSLEKQRQYGEIISIPRPGHADLTGTIKYGYNDIRNSIERSSARETAARVAACTIARKFLEIFGIYIGSFVENIGGVYSNTNHIEKWFENKSVENVNAKDINLAADSSQVRVLDKNHEDRIIRRIKQAKKKGDTLGGTFYVIATGLPIGLGSFMNYDNRLEAEIAQSIMSIHAVKGVEFGIGFSSGDKYGSEVHDEILIANNRFSRKSNRAGGIEGGISTGMPIILRAVMKPIATLMSPLKTIDLRNMNSIESRRERSDFVAVPACSVIAESMTAWAIAKLFLEKFGGDSIEETKSNYISFTKDLVKKIKQNFRK